MRRSLIKYYIIFPAVLLAVFFLSVGMDNYRHEYRAYHVLADSDFIYNMVGEIRSIFSDYAFIRADEYLHGGVLPDDAELFHSIGEEDNGQYDYKVNERGEKISSVHADARDDAGSGHEHGEHHHHHKKKSLNDPLTRLASAVLIGDHIHLKGKEELEILPWFEYAVDLNPKNERAYTIAGYWLGIRFDEVTEAVNILNRGIRDNPSNWQIYDQLGRVYYHKKNDIRMALKAFLSAERNIDMDNSDKFQRRQLRTYIAVSYEKMGFYDKSLRYYEEIYKEFPDRPLIKDKIEALKLRNASDGL